VPQQLPPAVRHFAGRVDALTTLTELADEVAMPGGTAVISAIGGTAGIGKTTLAVHWAHTVKDKFPDGQLYVNLRGFDPGGQPLTPSEAIRGFLDAFGVPPTEIPSGLEALSARYRSLLAGKRVLVVLDNARDVGQVRPLLPGTPGCLVVVTSRNQLLSLAAAEDAFLLTLDLLTHGEACQLLAFRLGEERTGRDPRATDELIAQCARLPLALGIVAARAAAEPTRTLADLAGQLRDARERLDMLDTGDPVIDIRAVFSWSCQSLSAPALRIFRLLGIHPGPDISAWAAASIAGLSAKATGGILRELTRANLFIERVPGRFTFHDLLRLYASEQVTDPERRLAIHRMLDHYLHTSHAAALLISPSRAPLSLPEAQPGVSPERHVDRRQAQAWFQTEREVLLGVIGQAENERLDAYAWQIPWALATFLQHWGHWDNYIATQQTSLAAAQRLGDLAREADTHYLLALAFGLAGPVQEAYAHMSCSLALLERLGDPVRLARSHTGLAWVLELQGRPAEALGYAQQALQMHRAAGRQTGQCEALRAVGWYHALLGDYEQTVACCREVLTLEGGSHDLSGKAATLDTLGYAYHHRGQYAEAIASYQKSLDLFRECGGRHETTTVLRHLGESYRDIGNHSMAREIWQQGLDILDALRHPDAEEIRARLRDLENSDITETPETRSAP
jgi:tetratricopeptide (TPR) repeat protein